MVRDRQSLRISSQVLLYLLCVQFAGCVFDTRLLHQFFSMSYAAKSTFTSRAISRPESINAHTISVMRCMADKSIPERMQPCSSDLQGLWGRSRWVVTDLQTHASKG